MASKNSKIKKPELSTNFSLPNEYPLFCFKYLQNVSIKDCRDHTFFYNFLKRLQKLSELGWKEIDKSHRHSYGTEKLPISKIKCSKLPSCITPEVTHLDVFRANGDNRAFLGVKISGGIFRIIFVETNFGDIYDHE